MANPEKGEVDLSVGGKSYVLVITTNAECEVEALMDAEIVDVYGQLDRGRRSAIRAILYGALREHHPDLTLLDAGKLLDVDRETVAEAAAKAVRLAYSSGKDDGARNPQAASGGAGETS